LILLDFSNRIFGKKGQKPKLAKVLLVTCLVFAGMSAISQNTIGAEAIVKTPAPVKDLILIQPFELEKEYRHTWSAEAPTVQSGTVVVVEVDPSLVVPRNAAEPILYAGDHTVQRLNSGDRSGRVVGIIPGDVDLTQAPIWFGKPGLPERVTNETIVSERALAERAGIKAFSAETVRGASRERVRASDLSALLREFIADLVLQYSPEERELVETWRLPVAGAKP
jgi:hypothetical protein